MIYLPNDFIPVNISTILYTGCIVVVVVAFLESTDDSIYTCMSHHVPQDPTTFSIDHLDLSRCDSRHRFLKILIFLEDGRYQNVK